MPQRVALWVRLFRQTEKKKKKKEKKKKDTHIKQSQQCHANSKIQKPSLRPDEMSLLTLGFFRPRGPRVFGFGFGYGFGFRVWFAGLSFGLGVSVVHK